MLDPKRIKNNALGDFWSKGASGKINARWHKKVARILNALDVAVSPQELDLPGFGFHRLKGDRARQFSLTISRNWRITFRWDEDGPYDVNMEDYHGD